MSSTFFGLELSRRALEAQQTALNTTGHNISNANTIGYTRQIAHLQATTPDIMHAMGHNMSIGTGTTVEIITRARDKFIDLQFRNETSKQQYWAARQDSLQKIEAAVNEPSTNSLSDDMNQFWTAWSDLSKNPENIGARAVVRERAITLTDSFNALAQQVSDLQRDLNNKVQTQIKQINTYSDQIKDLNAQIKLAEIQGDSPNDLRDKRDILVDEISQIVNVKVVESQDPAFTDRKVGLYKLEIGDSSQTLIDDSQAYHLQDSPYPTDASGITVVQWKNGPNTGMPLDFGDKLGQLQADIDSRDTYLKGFSDQIDTLAEGLVTAVNTLHESGVLSNGTTGIDFFDSTKITAKDITLSAAIADITTGLNSIATGVDGKVGDGSLAADIANLSQGWSTLASPPLTSASLGDSYGAIVAQMGVDVQQANRMKAGEDVLVNQITNQKESQSGVSLDEEMTNLVKFQKSYAAAARMVTMMDSMLDTIVNGMGITR